MTLFFDDFERANGAPGNGWANAGNPCTISNGNLIAAASGVAYQTTFTESGRQEVALHCFYGGPSNINVGPLVKTSSTGLGGFYLCFADVTSTPALVIRNGAGAFSSVIATYTFAAPPGPYHELKLVWELGHLSGYCDGILRVEVDHSAFATNANMGVCINNNGGVVPDFRMVGGSALGFTVSPSAIGNFGGCSSVALTGVGTSWTTGTPGAPTFTVDHGTISAQVVSDSTHATLTYCPGSYLGPVVFADPSTGQTAGAVVTSDPAVVPPGTSYLFTPQAVAMVNNTAGESYIERLLKPNTSVDVEGVASLELDTVLGKVALNTGATVTPTSLPSATLLYTLYRLVNGGYPSAVGPFTSPTYETLDAGLTDHRDRLDALITSNHWTLGDVITELAGEGVKTHLDLYNAIGAISGGSNAEVLDAISAAKGDPLATIKAVLDSLFVLSTVNNYTLATVKTWVEAVRGSGLPTVKSVMDKLGGSSNTIETRIDALSDLIATETTIQSIINIAVGALSGREGSSIASVLDAIDALPAPTPPTPQLAAPVWPGDGLATLGTSHALADGLIVDGPIHGLIVTIDGHPNGAGKYAFGSVMSWQHCGAVVFRDDAGHYERAESFGLPSQIITPRSMAAAASATVRLNGGWSGTIRGWTVTP